MKRITQSLLALCMALVLCAALLPGTNTVSAAEDAPTQYLITRYDTSAPSITINQNANVTVYLSRISGAGAPTRVVRGVDSFRMGTAGEPVALSAENGEYCFTISNLVYSGEGSALYFTVYYDDGTNQTFSNLSVNECVPYTEPEEPELPVVTIPAPRAVFSSDAGLLGEIGAGETRMITLYVQNAGTTTMYSPMVKITPSSALMVMDTQSAYILDDIRPGQSGIVLVTVKAADTITEQNQSLTASVEFYYDNGSGTSADTASGSVNIPAKLSEESGDTSGVASPTPIVILSQYSYGGSSVAAGASTNLSFTFKNTSKTIAIENVMVTVSGGTDLMINGSTNTFYYDAVAAQGTQNVTVPLKAAQIVSSGAQAVQISVSYEYVDQNQRHSGSASLTLSVPLYQPDRFELNEPKLAYVGYAGEETSLTIDYVNKGKSAISNVEAYISGDVDTYTSYQRVGTIEGGKSGSIAFAITPQNEGENSVTIQILYEDANGNSKERVFETTVEAMAYPVYEPSDEDMGYYEEPVDEGGSFPWKYVIAAAVVVLIIVLIVVRKKKKKAKMLAEQALWDKWDEEELAKETAAQAADSTPAGAGAEEQSK